MTQPATTFALLRQHDACKSGYRKLAKHLGGVTKYGKDKPIPLLMVLESNGLDDTLWSLRATLEPWERDARLYAADCAEHVLPIFEKQRPDDDRPRKAIEAARAFARGEIDDTARAAAGSAAGDAARAAVRAAAGSAARAAVRAAAGSAARAAARDAARAAAWDAVRAAAGSAERDWQAKRLRQYLTGKARTLKRAA